uniref:uncharacterized protein LOC120334358 isoform X3 n=1 Tax=Styela clava TaxID=7725 RepID=UPI001939308E|nr:uncharacterized protein LOC120334358 isoform X3 [Styela clava]
MDSRKEEKKLVYHKPDKGKSNSGIPVGRYKEKINNRLQMPKPNYGSRRKEIKTSTKHEDEDEEEIREEIEIDCSTNDVILRLRNFPFAPIRRNSMKNKQGAMAEKKECTQMRNGIFEEEKINGRTTSLRNKSQVLECQLLSDIKTNSTIACK